MTNEVSAMEPDPAAEVIAARLQQSARGGTERMLQWLQELGRLDRDLYAAIANVPTPTLDEPIRRLSNSANYSLIWLSAAGGLAIAGGRKGRKAALAGVLAIGITSAVVNQGIKRLYPRPRPDRAGEQVPLERHVRMPGSTSFPSGHSASGFAFATAVGAYAPVLGAPLRFMAAAVAYSRVHTGVHYPGDAVIGSLLGASIGGLVAAVARRWLAGPPR
ncbi:MAG: phosphatase PAP2 family protein [Actinobacteria bacterium]|nr:phosphatase PAP2 family protein [Actinomycetota bacterium]